jgi:hypothetical protein
MFDARAIIQAARAEGVTLAMGAPGKIKVLGEWAAVARWVPYVMDHKPGLLWQLANLDEHPRPSLR